ncbi:MAG: HEAT repeat domain-containing protein [Planctomycetota bacterium]
MKNLIFLCLIGLLILAACSPAPREGVTPAFDSPATIFDDAIEYYDVRTVVTNPNPSHYFNLGRIYDERLDNPAKAIFCYTKYLELAPDAADQEKVKKWIEGCRKRVLNDRTSRAKFSAPFLKQFPDICEKLIALDARGKFEILQQVTEPNQRSTMKYISYKYKNCVENSDIAYLIGEIMQDGGKGLSFEDKDIILAVCAGRIYQSSFSSSMEMEGGWHAPIPEAIPHIRKLLDDSYAYISAETIRTIAILGDKESIPEIGKLLDSKEYLVVERAVEALGRLDAKEYIPRIMEILKTQAGTIRGRSAEALGLLGVREVIPEALKLLKDGESHNRWLAINTLVALDAKEYITEITKMLKDEHPDVRQSALQALGKFNSKETIPEIMKSLSDESGVIRGYAAAILAELDAKEAIPEIRRLVESSYYYERGMAAFALIKLDPAVEIPQAVIDDLKDRMSGGYDQLPESVRRKLGVEID